MDTKLIIMAEGMMAVLELKVLYVLYTYAILIMQLIWQLSICIGTAEHMETTPLSAINSWFRNVTQ